MTSVSQIQNLFPDEKELPAEFSLPDLIEQQDYLCHGQLVPWEGSQQEVYSPIVLKTTKGVQQKIIGTYPLLTEKEAMAVLKAAVEAYDNGAGFWPTMPVEDRIKCVQNFVFHMKEKRNEIINLLMWEIGKNYPDACKEFDRTIEYIKDTIDELKNLDRIGSRFVIAQGIIGQIRRAPLGVVLCMGPFNYPLNETFTTLIPALIMGNTVIFKPPKLGVLLHRPLLEAFRDAFPSGVVNTVYGEGQKVISPLMQSGKIDVLAFIGSSRVADILKSQHPKPHRLRCVLGLEAKNAGIILPDADLEATVKECVLGSLSFNGQRCTALKILFVHRKIVRQFLDLFCAALAKLKLGMPLDDNVGITPLPEPGKSKYLTELIEDAKNNGAEIFNDQGGLFYESLFYPAVLYPVNDRMRLYHEEQFGPVIPVVAYDDIAKPIAYVANSNYGQQVSVFGKDAETLGKLIDPLVNQVCRVNLNSQCQRGPDTFPFTGRKDSAEGTLSVSDALRVFTIRTLVTAKETDLNKQIIEQIIRERHSGFLSTDFIL